MKIPRSILVLAASSLSSWALAVPTPIDGPMVISESGDYVVTKDFTAFFVPAIKLQGDAKATIDLQGHTISAYAAPVVQVRATNDDDGCRTLTLRNGVVAGGYGLSSMSGGPYACSPSLSIDGVFFQSADLYVEDVVLAVTSSIFMGGGIFSLNNVGGPANRIRGNRLFGGDIVVIGDDGGRIQANTLRGGSIIVMGDGVRETAHMVITTNLVGGNLFVGGESAGQGAAGMYVAKNRIYGYALLTQTSDTTLELNQISRCGPLSSEVGVVFGTADRIDGNLFAGSCEHGLVLDELSRLNEYSANTFRMYTSGEPVLDLGTDNRNGDAPSQVGDDLQVQ